MVNLFSFGCHVIDRAYVRLYRLYGWGRGDYQKEGRDASVVSWQIHIFYIGHSQYGQLTAVKTRYPLSGITWTYRGLMCQLIEVTWFIWKLAADQLIVLLYRDQCLISYFLASLNWEHRKTDNAHILDINFVINWQLLKQGICWPVSLESIAGSGVNPSRSSIFWSYPLTSY